jgi:hypothetical protein
MINFAVIKNKLAMQNNKGINCPDNHNLKKKATGPDLEKNIEPNLQIKFILKDFVLPPRAVMIGHCWKKR